MAGTRARGGMIPMSKCAGGGNSGGLAPGVGGGLALVGVGGGLALVGCCGWLTLFGLAFGGARLGLTTNAILGGGLPSVERGAALG